MISRRCEAWRTVREIEDALAMLNDVEDRRKVIRAQAWRQGSWEAVFEEATAMKRDIDALRETLAAGWERWTKEANDV
jgi:hypothetical protein